LNTLWTCYWFNI